jgi:hypothetical protein
MTTGPASSAAGDERDEEPGLDDFRGGRGARVPAGVDQARGGGAEEVVIVGWSVVGEDNDSYMYSDADNVPRCVSCGLVSTDSYVNPGFVLRKKGYDLSSTYDGCDIASERFVTFLRQEQSRGVRIYELPSAPGFYRFAIDVIVPFDANRRGTRFVKPCSECQRFTQIAGAYPCFLINQQKPLVPGIYRTDQVFGSGNEQGPAIVLGYETGQRLKRMKLKGLTIEGITS